MPRKNKQSVNPNGEPAPDERSPVDAKLVRPLTLSVVLVFLLVAVAAFVPGLRLWGVNHLNYYSVPVRVVALALLALTFVPAVNRRLYRAMLTVSRTIKTGGTRVDLALTVIAVASVVMFWSLRASTNLLGDGQLLAQSYEAGWDGHERVIMRGAGAIVTEERIAPGTILAYYTAARVITSVFDKGPVWAIKLFVCWLGAFFVYFFLGAMRKGPFSPEIRLWLILLTLFSTVMQLFFGYIENYALLVFLGVWYVLTGFAVVHGRLRLWVPIVLFVTAFYCHIQAVLFAPSLVYLIAWQSMKSRRKLVERRAGPALVAGSIVVAIAAGFTGIGDYYLPLRGGKWFYGMFSPSHFVDILNEVLMLMPVVPLFAVMAWVNRTLARRAEAGQEKAGRGEATGWFAMAAEWHFSTLVLVPCFLYLFLFKPEIGMARDWDLFTITLVGMVPLALLIINRFFRTTKIQSGAASFTVPAAAICLSMSVFWIGVNASPTRSAARFERILVYDKTHAAYAYENLAIFYHDRGMLDKATEIIKTACELSNNPRQWIRLGMYYEDQDRKEEAIELMRRTVEEHSDHHKARMYLIALLEPNPNKEELWTVAREGLEHHPKEPIYWFYYGQESINKGKIEEGIAAFRKCLSLNPPEGAREHCIEQIQKHSGQQK
jgi:hypothetical protein